MVENIDELTPEATRLWQEIAPRIQQKREELQKIPVSILIWGPTPSIDTPVGRIRLELRSELRKKGHLAVFSEELYDPGLSIENRIQQLMQAQEFQLIISIPASPGSIGEIHDFTIDARVNSKIVVFLNREYNGGYSNQSLLAVSSVLSCEIYYYENLDNIPQVIPKSIAIADKIREYMYLYGRRM